MAVTDSGLNESAAVAAIQDVIDGGVDIHLLTTQGSYTDSSTEIINKSEAVVSVAESEFSISPATDFTDTTVLTVTSDVEFGAQSIGVVESVAILGSDDEAIIGIEEDTPDLTGELYTLPAGTVLYEVGNVA